MSTALIAYTPHVHQAKVHLSTANKKVIVKGRQSGGTVAAVQEAALWAYSAPKRWPDARFPQFWWVTAFDGTMGKAWRDFGAYVPKDVIARKHESQAWFELRNGSRISMQSAEGMKSLVSEQLHGLVCDEFCQYREAVYNDYLAPMLSTTGGPQIFVGSPWGMNWGYRHALTAQRTPGWSYHHWTSYDSPYADKGYLEGERLRMPDRAFRQQYLAEFLTDGGELFRNIDAAISPPSQPDGDTVIGFDIARSKDWSHLYAFNGRGEWVDSKRVGHLDWSVQRVAAIEMYKRVGARKILIDITGAGPRELAGDIFSSDLRRDGLVVEPVHIDGALKQSLIQNLMWRFDMNAIRIAMDTADEFRRYTSVTTAAGNERFSAPEGEHDDQVMAAALAMWGLRAQALREIPKPKSELEAILEREIEQAGTGFWNGREYDIGGMG